MRAASRSWSRAAPAGIYLDPLQREPLRALLQNGTVHLALPIDLEFEDRPSRVLRPRRAPMLPEVMQGRCRTG